MYQKEPGYLDTLGTCSYSKIAFQSPYPIYLLHLKGMVKCAVVDVPKIMTCIQGIDHKVYTKKQHKWFKKQKREG